MLVCQEITVGYSRGWYAGMSIDKGRLQQGFACQEITLGYSRGWYVCMSRDNGRLQQGLICMYIKRKR
jgi:hypothetical protein